MSRSSDMRNNRSDTGPEPGPKLGPDIRPADRLFVALDLVDVNRAASLAHALAGRVGGIKIGKEFFTANGPEGFRRLADAGLPIFLDLKFHDIPTTVARAVRAALPLRPLMLDVHASGGAAMMRAAAAAAAEGTAPLGGEAAGVQPLAGRPLVIAVTILTSLRQADLDVLGVSGSVQEQVIRLAVLAKNCGLDGAVCSCAELMALRGACGADFVLVVPGIRPSWAEGDEHRRTITPAEAIALGADYIVVGRPIVQAPDPAEAAARICEELASALPRE
jgi:orotidine-5'-phosphate decarboxylase